MDELFGTTKIGEGIGMFVIFTNGTAFALARFLHEDIYSK